MSQSSSKTAGFCDTQVQIAASMMAVENSPATTFNKCLSITVSPTNSLQQRIQNLMGSANVSSCEHLTSLDLNKQLK